MSTVIIKNNTSSAIFLEDLGCEIPGSGQRNLTDTFDKFEISSSTELKNYVFNETFMVNDGTSDLGVAAGLRHINFETQYEDVDGISIYSNGQFIGQFTELDFTGTNIADSTSGILIEVPQLEVAPQYICQARLTSDYTLSSTWGDISFDTTDEETDSNVIEHDPLNTDRIIVKETGKYEIGINTTAENTTTQSIYYRLRINDSTVIEGSQFEVELYAGEIHGMSRNIYVSLSKNDYVTLQMYSQSAESTTLFSNATIQVLSLNGTKGKDGKDGIDGDDGLPGDPGPPGSGTTINVYEDGLPAASEVAVLNFEGNVDVYQEDSTSAVTIEIISPPFEVKEDGIQISDSVESINFENLSVTQDSVSEVTVASIFGSQFQETSSDSESSTTSTTYQQKVRLTTPSLPSGKYRIGWYYEWRYDDDRSDFRGRVQINDTTTIMEHQQEPKDEGSNQWYPASGFGYVTQSGILNIDLDYCSDDWGDTSAIRRARLEIWRVS